VRAKLFDGRKEIACGEGDEDREQKKKNGLKTHEWLDKGMVGSFHV
jgi:hypothetical protein